MRVLSMRGLLRKSKCRVALGIVIAMGVIGMAPAVAVSAQPVVQLRLNGDVVIATGGGFPLSSSVTVVGVIPNGSGQANTPTNASGGFLIGFSVPAGFAGTVNVTATAGTLTASQAIAVGAAPVAATAPAPVAAESPVAAPAPVAAESPVAAPTPAQAPAQAQAPAAVPHAACVAPPNLKQQDLDPKDSADPYWKRTGLEVQVAFATGGLPAQYAADVASAAKTWARSVCIAATTVPSCSGVTNCVPVATSNVKNGSVDGEFVGQFSGGYKVGGHIDLFLPVLSKEPAQDQLAVITHEMGHAIGLQHRKSQTDLMLAVGSAGTAIPDKIDYDNLLAIYGTRRGSTAV